MCKLLGISSKEHFKCDGSENHVSTVHSGLPQTPKTYSGVGMQVVGKARLTLSGSRSYMCSRGTGEQRGAGRHLRWGLEGSGRLADT